MRTIFCIIFILLCLNANDFEKTLKNQSEQNSEKEYNNEFGKTLLKSDPNANNLSIDNLTPLYENKSNFLFFQKQSTLNNNNQEYQSALIYHYKKDSFSLGFHSSINGKNFNPNLRSELIYKDYFKAYTQYTQNDENDLQQSLGFMVLNLNFDLSKDNQGENYGFSYKPYGNAFSINLNHKNFNENIDSNSVLFGFDFNFNENFSKQLFRKDIQNNYDFLQ